MRWGVFYIKGGTDALSVADVSFDYTLDPVLGTARIASKELLDALPMFKWESIFTLA